MGRVAQVEMLLSAPLDSTQLTGQWQELFQATASSKAGTMPYFQCSTSPLVK